MSENVHILWDVINIPGVLKVDPTGSREICNPAPTDTDYDIICLVNRDIHNDLVDTIGFEHTSNQEGYEDIDSFIDCYQYEEINLVVIRDPDFYRKFRSATILCKALNVLDKTKRLEIFDLILYRQEKLDDHK
jgi:hypothetical protein